jgi:predicted DNA-binding ArsR family transcriptional regulator
MLGMSTDEQIGENEDQVKSLVLENRTITTINVANMLTVSSESVQCILNESLNCISLLQN